MRIKYVGDRQSVGTTCHKGGRAEYYFGPENSFTCDVPDQHAQELLKSVLHRFELVSEEVIKPEASIIKPPILHEVPKEKPKEKLKKEPKKRGRKKNA